MLLGTVASTHPNAGTDGIENSIHAINRLWLRLRRFASGLRELATCGLRLVPGPCWGVPIRWAGCPTQAVWGLVALL